MQRRIDALPSRDISEDEHLEELRQLEKDIRDANRDYMQALNEAHTLSSQLDALLKRLARERHSARDELVHSA